MKSRQFPTFADAIAYMEERGKIEYFGRDGRNCEYCVYTLTIGVRVYHCDVYNDGLLEVTHERYKRMEE